MAANHIDWSKRADRTKRECRGCGKEKPLTPEYFPPDKPHHEYPSRRMRYYCRICTRAQARAYRLTPAHRKHVAENREMYRKYGATRRQKDKFKALDPKKPANSRLTILRNRARVWVYKHIRLKRLPARPTVCPDCSSSIYKVCLFFPLGPERREVYAWRCMSCVEHLKIIVRAEREKLAVDPEEWREIHARHVQAHADRQRKAAGVKAYWSAQGLDPYEMSVALGLEEMLEDHAPYARRDMIRKEIARRNNPEKYGRA